MDNPRSSAPTQPSCVNPGTGTNPPARQCSAHARPFSYSYYRQARMPRSSCWSRMPAGCGNAWHAASAGSRASLSRGDGLGGSPCGARRSAQVSVPQSRRPSQPTDLIHITMHFAGGRWVPGHRDCRQGGRLPGPAVVGTRSQDVAAMTPARAAEASSWPMPMTRPSTTRSGNCGSADRPGSAAPRSSAESSRVAFQNRTTRAPSAS